MGTLRWVSGERKRLTLDLDDRARQGWELMGRRAGGNFTAMGNALGEAMLEAIEAGMVDPCWLALRDRMLDVSYDRRHGRRGGGSGSAPPDPEPKRPQRKR